MHTHSHYLLFLIGLRHCRKLVPKICQPASPQMFQKENQVSITRFTSLARGDRSADQCLLSAAGSSTKGKRSLSTGPNSCQVCTSLGRPGQRALQTATAALWDLAAAATCLHPEGLCGHSPNPDSSEPQGASGSASHHWHQGQDLPYTRTAVGRDSKRPSPWAESPSSAQESKHTSLLSATSASPLISTLYSMALQKKTADIPTVPLMEKTEMILKSCMNKIFCFFPTYKHQAWADSTIGNRKVCSKKEILT